MERHLPAPLPLSVVLATVIEPTYAHLLPGKFNSQQATVMLLAIGLQESRFQHREQVRGPAKGFWQFERGGGVTGVLTHPLSRRYAQAVLELRRNAVQPFASAESVHLGLADDDWLACAFARLLLYTDAQRLPSIGDAEGAWDYYRRVWGPGKPHRGTWDGLYLKAIEAAA